MTPELSNFAARLLPLLRDTARQAPDNEFNELALELFALQFKHNAAYQKICKARLPRRSGAKAGGLTPEVIEHWTRIPAVPTAAFKELELTCLAPDERTAVFHSSGTTEQNPSRHFHNTESLAVYEASLWSWFERHVVPKCEVRSAKCGMLILTPPPEQAPHSSLVHMFETVRKCSVGCSPRRSLRRSPGPQPIGALGIAHATTSAFVGHVAADSSWILDFDVIVQKLKAACDKATPVTLLGTAFSFVHLLDFLGERNLPFQLPLGSRVMETGGYKNRSRTMLKTELHALITRQLGIPQSHIVCEYGMSELSSQAYDEAIGRVGCPQPAGWRRGEDTAPYLRRYFHFPPWARVQVISSETNREVADGEAGLIRVFDLANVFSVMAIQTEDLGVRHDNGFELLGRAQFAEPRGCSLMSIESK